MRKWVDRYLSELADSDENVRLLIADVGDFPVFSKLHPDKFINIGVSESNCINVAAGMASTGLRVFVYGVSGFFLYRAYEQFKYSVSNWQQPITFIGVGFGWKYYNIGVGHFTPDDIALCRLIPNMRIFTPYCLSQLKRQLFEQSKNSLCYLRITANIIDEIFESNCPMGNYDGDIILSYGEMSNVAILVGQRLASKQAMNVILLDEVSDSKITELAFHLKERRIITIEDQCYYGTVACALSRHGIITHKSYMLPIKPIGVSDSRESLLKMYKLDVDSIVNDLMS